MAKQDTGKKQEQMITHAAKVIFIVLRSFKRMGPRLWFTAILPLLIPSAACTQSWEAIPGLGARGNASIQEIVSGPEQQLIIAGEFSDSLFWGNQSLLSMGPKDGFIIQIDEKEQSEIILHLQSRQEIELSAILWSDIHQKLAVYGRYQGEMILPDTILNSPSGNSSLFLYVFHQVVK